MAVSYFGVDAFSAVPFGGNPAVVCLLDAHAESGTEPDEGWMRQVGAEFNQPATAFLWRDARGYRLRWFTASTELPLCGHGTLAAAHVLYETDLAGADQALTFQTAVTATCWGHRIWLELPSAALTGGLAGVDRTRRVAGLRARRPDESDRGRGQRAGGASG
jgi:PhzF family phenazine biosynthesis protein